MRGALFELGNRLGYGSFADAVALIPCRFYCWKLNYAVKGLNCCDSRERRVRTRSPGFYEGNYVIRCALAREYLMRAAPN